MRVRELENPLDNNLGFQIVVAARSMKRTLEIKLNEYGITSSQYTVLEILNKYNGLSLTEENIRLAELVQDLVTTTEIYYRLE